MPGPAGRGTWAQGGAGAGADVMTASQTTTFGALLRRYRRAASLSQEALAERAGLSMAAISALERGRRTPRPETVQMLAAALALTPQQRASLIAMAQPPDAAAAGTGRPMPAPL